MQIVAIDAKDLMREGFTGKFNACIGASVLMEENARFRDQMNQAWDDARRTYGISHDDITLKSAHVKRIIGPSDAHSFGRDVIHAVSEHIKEVHFHYTYLNLDRIPEVQVYGRDLGPNERWPTLEFLERLSPTYTHCCAWKDTQDMPTEEAEHSMFLLDHFEAKITWAWEDLATRDPARLQVWCSGDLCNPYIRLADTVVSYLDSKMRLLNAKLYPSEIERAFGDEPFEVKASYLGQRYLPKITPVTRRMSDTRRYLKHPILFVVGPRTPALLREEGMGTKDILETHTTMQRIVDYAQNIGGAVKFLHVDGDQRLFRPEDQLIYVGNEGKETAKLFADLYGIKILDASQI